MEIFSYWFMFPVAVAIAAIAMFFGVGGAVLFSPFFAIALSLRIDIAIALGILIEVAGFSSGFIGFAKKGMVNFHLGSRILPLTTLFAIVGALIGKNLPGQVLEFGLALLLFLLAAAFLHKESGITPSNTPLHPHDSPEAIRRLRYDYWRDFRQNPWLFISSSFGGLMVGLVSAGLGELNGYNFVKKLGMGPALAAGTSVFVIAVTALTASIFNISYFSTASSSDIDTIVRIALFAIPGVIIGAQAGIILARKIEREKVSFILPWFLAILGVLTVMKIF
ncbi:MAG: sulfite exporter TauE/SafE family protein [Dehalogenimonas sp.]|jgi:uncharacterized membrane protein YfcA|uniref:Probable membrane transporter protein n=1 Tax=Candidatus Dehalogenimonas loeffleri TaxID=3127115 RepID=A0ABZ2J3G7_9CHLR|nr:sulfite exporter TauE/SafE family protein [Dehalogenimonas sp.]